jgi:hypothetical protein
MAIARGKSENKRKLQRDRAGRPHQMCRAEAPPRLLEQFDLIERENVVQKGSVRGRHQRADGSDLE